MGRRGTQIAFALFAAVLTVIGGSKTNSPPDRLLRRIIGAVLPPVSSNYPYGQSVWPFDAATSNAVSGLASTIVQPIPDAMAETGVALYRANPDISILGRPLDVQPILEWSVHDIDNRGVSADLPFAFPFNVRSYTNVGVLSNGRLAFGHATLHRRTSQGLPVPFPRGLEIAAPFWGDHLVAAESGSAVCTIATSNEFAVVWENLVTPEAGLTNTTTVVCRLAPDGRMSWFYSPASPSVTSNVTIGIQSGTNGWMLANGGNPPDMATLLSNGLRLDLVPVGGMEWAVADADGDMTAAVNDMAIYDRLTPEALAPHLPFINGAAAVGLKNGQPLTKELLVKSNPDILLLPNYDDKGNFDTEAFIRSYLDDPSLQTIKAIQNRRLEYPRESYIYNGSQDFVFGVQELAFIAYGDAFRQEDNRHISFSGEE